MTQGHKPVLRARVPNAHPVLYASSGHNRKVLGQLRVARFLLPALASFADLSSTARNQAQVDSSFRFNAAARHLRLP